MYVYREAVTEYLKYLATKKITAKTRRLGLHQRLYWTHYGLFSNQKAGRITLGGGQSTSTGQIRSSRRGKMTSPYLSIAIAPAPRTMPGKKFAFYMPGLRRGSET